MATNEQNEQNEQNIQSGHSEHSEKTNLTKPKKIENECRFDSFSNGKVILNKKTGRLPAMGWNSWNAFGSGNTEDLTKKMADLIVSLGLDECGYKYVVLDDGCYKSERVDGKLSNENVKFPSGFKALSDYVHSKGLKFGMYNDIGTNLCAGAAVGTCGHEDVDAASYIDWGVDFLKVDNCYYLWDNATFSDEKNARFVYAPNIKKIRIEGGCEINSDFSSVFDAVKDGFLVGNGAEKKEELKDDLKEGFVTNIGTFDGTGPDHTPVGEESGELCFNLNVAKSGKYKLFVSFCAGQNVGCGRWLQVAVKNPETNVSRLFYDDFVKSDTDEKTSSTNQFCESSAIEIELCEGKNILRLMNHRRQENTLDSYATLLRELNNAKNDHDIVLSICEWGKTQPQNWGYKVGDSWRILNDITFRVGSDGNPGNGSWTDNYTPSVTSQYNKAVIMDEFSGLSKGWNDPDMLMIGMDGLSDAMCRTHFAMWCMMNSPLMLGLDLRRVQKGDKIWKIIANKKLIALNQDSLGIQAKRVFCTLADENPDKTYVRDNNRVDILAKPLFDGSVALSFINLGEKAEGKFEVSVEKIVKMLGNKMMDVQKFASARKFLVEDLWSGEKTELDGNVFGISLLDSYENHTVKVLPL